jgi:kynureninase
MVLIGPDDGEYVISTAKILSIIDEHAAETALLLLPGLQYYSGQLFDIPTITRHAQARGIVVGWDLAHAYGNVEVKLHDWNVDFAVWCTYKYGNAGPGAIAGLFVHEKHGTVDYSEGEDKPIFRNRLTGWYGGDRSVRFMMDNSKHLSMLARSPAYFMSDIQTKQNSSQFPVPAGFKFPTLQLSTCRRCLQLYPCSTRLLWIKSGPNLFS